jgi:hypothetical protein
MITLQNVVLYFVAASLPLDASIPIRTLFPIKLNNGQYFGNYPPYKISGSFPLSARHYFGISTYMKHLYTVYEKQMPTIQLAMSLGGPEKVRLG